MGTEDFMTNQEGKGGGFGRWIPLVLIVLVIGFYIYGSRPSGPVPGWLTDPAMAFAQAAEKKSSLVLAFYSDGCPPCKAMDRSVLGTGAVQDALTGYVPVRVDAWKEIELKDKYGVEATPTFIIADSSGKPLARTEGFHDVDDFVSFLNRGRLAAER
jgi:thioredoxin-related protein